MSDINKLLDAAAAFRIAAESLENVAEVLKMHEIEIKDLNTRMSKNDNVRRKIYDILREEEEY